MSVSTNDELEAIERSARISAPAVAPASGGRRRGSSMFSGAGAVMSFQQAMDGTGAAAPAPGLVSGSSTTDQDSNLLVDFPGKVPTSSVAAPAPPPIMESKKRQSVVLQPMPGLGDFMNSDSEDDDDDDDDEDAALAAAAAAGRLPGQPIPGAPDTMGGPNHRPLVGGFAAAAYEAARAHHYASKNKRN